MKTSEITKCPYCGDTEIYRRGIEYLCGNCRELFSLSLIRKKYTFLPVYSQKDKEIVDRIIDIIKQHGHDILTLDNVPENKIEERILEYKGQVDRCLYFVSQNSISESDPVSEVLEICRNIYADFQIILLDNTGFSEINVSYMDRQVADVSGWRENDTSEKTDIFLEEKLQAFFNTLLTDDKNEKKDMLQKINMILGINKKYSEPEHKINLVYDDMFGEEIEQWRTGKNISGCFVIFGNDSVIRSAYCNYLLSNNLNISGAVFLENDISAEYLIKLLAYRIAEIYPSYRKILYEQLLRESNNTISILCDLSIEELYDYLIGGTFIYTINGGHNVELFIIDGIEHITDGREELMSIFSQKVSEITWLKFILSCPQDDELKSYFYDHNKITLD